MPKGLSVLAALLLMIIGAGGIFLLALFLNPPSTPYAVAIVEIAPGETLTRDMFRIDDGRLNRNVLDKLVTEGELDQFVGGVAVESIHALEPLRKSAISTEGNPAAINRISLALTDPNIVAMVIPVDRETSPNEIAGGDYIDINFGVGSATFQAGSLAPAPTPFPFQPIPNVFVTDVPVGTPTPTATPAEQITLPVAKTLVHAARVLNVVYDEIPNPAYSGPGSGVPATVKGDVVALVVTVPTEAQELVQFAVVNGSLRIAVLSPSKDWSGELTNRQPTLGMSWEDMIAFFRMERESVLGTAIPTQVIGPGANAIRLTEAAAAATQSSITTVLTATQLQPTVAAPTTLVPTATP